mgnify:CR=1 FL=1
MTFSALALNVSSVERFVLNMLQKFRDWDAGLFEIDDALEWYESYTGMRIQEIMEVDEH